HDSSDCHGDFQTIIVSGPVCPLILFRFQKLKTPRNPGFYPKLNLFALDTITIKDEEDQPMPMAIEIAEPEHDFYFHDKTCGALHTMRHSWSVRKYITFKIASMKSFP
ncbi:hypothetical protein M8C21_013502, partial [Ambrosia artemisiifolia]